MSKGGIEFPAELEESIANDIITNGAEEEQFDHSYLDAVQAYVSQKSRDKMSTEDFGWPEEKKYPIRNQRDLDAASKLIGRAPADKQASIKARIKRIAKRKGLTLPASWGGDK
jgi:hypothetical protein